MRLLLVDDHMMFREGLALLLAASMPDVAVLEAGSCEEALELLERASDFELALIDLKLSGMNGIDGMRVMRERHPDVSIVALSSEDDRDTVLQALDAGAMGFITKSSSSAVLVGALKLILAKGIYLPPSAFLGESARSSTSGPPSDRVATTTRSVSELGLSPRQSEVFYAVVQGKAAKVIARELGLSVNTVKSHTSAVLRALNVTTRTQAVLAAGRLGFQFSRTCGPGPSSG